jgi:phage gp46-like protein
MPDITVVWRPTLGLGDWNVVGPDLETGDDLVTAVLVSLFTDGRAQDGDVIPDGSQDRRGFWGDPWLGSPLGSRLWLIDRAKQTEAIRLAAEDFAHEALAWMVTSRIVASVDIEAEWMSAGFLGLVITLNEADGSVVVLEFRWAWAALAQGGNG